MTTADRELLRRMVDAGCTYASEIDGEVLCFYCGAEVNIEPHDESCAFEAAKRHLASD